MVGPGANNTDANAVTLVPASISIDDIDAVSCVQVIDSTLTVDTPDLEETIPSVTAHTGSDRRPSMVTCTRDNRGPKTQAGGTEIAGAST